MKLGECITATFTLLKDNPSTTTVSIDVPKSSVEDCCFQLPVLAKAGGTTYENDKSSWIWWASNGINAVTLLLQKEISGTWTTQATLTDNTYGTNQAYGDIINDRNESLFGYILDWELVLAAFDTGLYRLKTEENTVLGDTVNRYSFDWCLSEYTDYRADETVRIDWYNHGIIGDYDNDSNTLDYASLNWFNQLRLPDSLFGKPKANYSSEYTQYANGERIWTSKTKVDEFSLTLGRYPAYLHTYIQDRLLMSDSLSITNYNANAAINYQDKEIRVPDALEYDPQWIDDSKLSDYVTLLFNSLYENHKQKRC